MPKQEAGFVVVAASSHNPSQAFWTREARRPLAARRFSSLLAGLREFQKGSAGFVSLWFCSFGFIHHYRHRLAAGYSVENREN